MMTSAISHRALTQLAHWNVPPHRARDVEPGGDQGRGDRGQQQQV
jgi:hypothetical protein